MRQEIGRLRDAHRHHEAVLDAEVRRLTRTLSGYGVVSRGQLLELSGAQRWRRGRFSQALARAVEHGFVRSLGYEFYAPPREGFEGWRPQPFRQTSTPLDSRLPSA